MYKRQNQRGFTLIELIVTILILGILAAIAIPRYADLSTTAQQTTTKAIAANLSSANSDNYYSRTVNSSLGKPITNCTQVANLLDGGLPSGYKIKSASVAVNVTKTCTLTGLSSSIATFYATGIH